MSLKTTLLALLALTSGCSLLQPNKPTDVARGDYYSAGKPEFDALMHLHHEIEEIKLRFAATRVARLESELDRLKVESPEDYRRIASKLADEERA